MEPLNHTFTVPVAIAEAWNARPSFAKTRPYIAA